MKNNKAPKVLFIDIETSPLEVFVWGIHDQVITSNQIIKDWSVLSWCAKWQGSGKLIYQDTRKCKDPRDDKNIIENMWKLLDEADIVIGQNSIRFDTKKLNTRFEVHKMGPTSSFKQIDTLKIAKKYFGFTSNKLEDLCNKLGLKYRKSQHKKFPGLDLWKECLAKNSEAWKEMENYNKQDVLALEALYDRFIPWDSTINFSIYSGENICSCGSKNFKENGHSYEKTGIYKRYKCKNCKKELKERQNLLSKERRKTLTK